MQQMIACLREKESKLARDKKGFTLVELIVVLVILAILAAILVPTLLGYINQANTEKNYSTAQTVRVAAQSVASDKWGRNADDKTSDITLKSETASGQSVLSLAGVDSNQVTACDFKLDDKGQITGGTVTIDGSTYTLTITDGKNSWTAAKSTTASGSGTGSSNS